MDCSAQADFAVSLMRARAGVALLPDNVQIAARLAPLARREGLASGWTLLDALRRQPDSPLMDEAVGALAPAETWFFRDRAAFAHLADPVLPQIFDAARADGGRPVRIWCAGCGAGQEAYSLGMLLEERSARGQPADASILATDLSPAALTRAGEGRYNQFEVQHGLSIRRLIQHFDQDGRMWRAAPALRRRLDVRRHNLLHDAAALGRFDIVLLRHVLMHLAPDLRGAVLARVLAQLRPGGVLMLGAGETVPAAGLDSIGLHTMSGAPGFYRAHKRPAARAA